VSADEIVFVTAIHETTNCKNTTVIDIRE